MTFVEPEIVSLRTEVEEIYHEGGPLAETPSRRGFIAAVTTNPFAGDYVEDIAGYMEVLKPLGLSLARQLIKSLGGAENIQSYGKGAIVGSAGETEHAALWHVPGGKSESSRFEIVKDQILTARILNSAHGLVLQCTQAGRNMNLVAS